MIYLLSFILTFNIHAEVGEHTKTPESTEAVEKKDELIDFSSIKDLIKKDGLEGELKKKEEEKRKFLDDKKRIELRKFNIPSDDQFWTFFSELWLVKNATRLKWDFHKPDFELEKSFSRLLEDQGLFEKKFKILLLDTPELAHAALPSNSEETILLISMPFIKTLDLSKVEISILLFEDFIRNRKGYFKDFVMTPELKAYLGSNFNGKPFNKKIIDVHLKKYSNLLFEKGFTFQEQFETTKEMDTLLKNDLKMWNTYLVMLEKIDQLTKNNLLFKNYTLIYPSPELQMNWLKPKTNTL
jgi:hypothetical protein